jgi:NaMN:DMB phosphoribosyltransferase
LHQDTVAQLGQVLAAAMSRQPVVLDGGTVAGYVDRALGRASMSVRG